MKGETEQMLSILRSNILEAFSKIKILEESHDGYYYY